MHHPANSITELYQGWEHDNACGESIPMYHSYWKEALLVVIGSSRYLSVCQRVDELRLSVVWYEVFSKRNCINVIRNLIHHD